MAKRKKLNPIKTLDKKRPPRPTLRKRKVPERYYKRLGMMSLDKGTMGGLNDDEKRLISWNAIMPCLQTCGALEVCPYRSGGNPMVEDDPVKKGNHVKCYVMVQYLKSVSSIIMENFSNDLTETELFKVGMHLIPLYKNLCRLKIEEMGIIAVVDTYSSKISPIYREMRATIKDIEGLWNSLGLNELEAENRKKTIVPLPDDTIFDEGGIRKGMKAR